MCEGAARASCSPGKESWKPSVVARLTETVASTTRSQDAEWHVRVQIGPRESDQGQHSPVITQLSDQAGLRPSQEAKPAGPGPGPGQNDRGMSPGSGTATPQLPRSPGGTSDKASAEKQLPRERRDRPPPSAVFTAALVSKGADLGLSQLNSSV